MELNIENLKATWKVRRLLSGRQRIRHPNEHELKEFFAVRNVTHAALAKELGVSLGTVLSWLNGVRPPNPCGEALLYQVQALIMLWESEHQEQFGS